MFISSAGKRIGAKLLNKFFKCPMLMFYDDIGLRDYKEYSFNKSLENTFNAFFMKRYDYVKVRQPEMRRFFSTCYTAYMSGYRESNKLTSNDAMRATNMIKKFYDVFGFDDDSIEYEVVDISAEYNVSCTCGSHYLIGVFNAILYCDGKHHIILYDHSARRHDKSYTMYSYLPTINLYAYNKAYTNKKDCDIWVYYTRLGKIQSVKRSVEQINELGRFICIANEALNGMSVWRIDDEVRCNSCAHKMMCRNTGRGDKAL